MSQGPSPKKESGLLPGCSDLPAALNRPVALLAPWYKSAQIFIPHHRILMKHAYLGTLFQNKRHKDIIYIIMCSFDCQVLFLPTGRYAREVPGLRTHRVLVPGSCCAQNTMGRQAAEIRDDALFAGRSTPSAAAVAVIAPVPEGLQGSALLTPYGQILCNPPRLPQRPGWIFTGRNSFRQVLAILIGTH